MAIPNALHGNPVGPPLPSANPFANEEPSREKAYDLLRGRPRSTTLTDRGSWIGNPFKDPMSDRFDPFGELEQKAQRARMQYLEEVRREQEWAALQEREKREESVIVGMQERERKESGVTVEGLGVLDRSGDSGGYPTRR